MDITQLMQFVPQILEAAGLIVAGATVLARLTPSSKDDTILGKIRRFLEKVSNMFLPDRQ